MPPRSRKPETDATASSDTGKTIGAEGATAPLHLSRPGSTWDLMPRRRSVKGYPVSRMELFELGGVGLITTVCFSAGFSYLNKADDIKRNLEFAKGTTEKLPPQLVSRWEAKAEDATLFGALAIIVGIVVLLGGGAKIWNIIWNTKHDGSGAPERT